MAVGFIYDASGVGCSAIAQATRIGKPQRPARHCRFGWRTNPFSALLIIFENNLWLDLSQSASRMVEPPHFFTPEARGELRSPGRRRLRPAAIGSDRALRPVAAVDAPLRLRAPGAEFLPAAQISPRAPQIGFNCLKEDQNPYRRRPQDAWIRRPGKLGANRP